MCVSLEKLFILTESPIVRLISCTVFLSRDLSAARRICGVVIYRAVFVVNVTTLTSL